MKCVICKRTDQLVNGPLEESDPVQVYRTVTCMNCGAQYNETFRMSSVYIILEDGMEGSDVVQEYTDE